MGRASGARARHPGRENGSSQPLLDRCAPDLVTTREPTAEADDRGGQPPITRPFPSAPETTSIMGLPFHQLDQQTLIGIVLEGLRARNGGWITPVNLDVLRQFTEDHESRELVLAASHRVADGAAHSLGLTPGRYAYAGKGPWQRPRPEPARGGRPRPGSRSFSSVEIRAWPRPPLGGYGLGIPVFKAWNPTAPHLDSRTIRRSWTGSWRRFGAQGRRWSWLVLAFRSRKS